MNLMFRRQQIMINQVKKNPLVQPLHRNLSVALRIEFLITVKKQKQNTRRPNSETEIKKKTKLDQMIHMHDVDYETK
jgi:hypothetical protein